MKLLVAKTSGMLSSILQLSCLLSNRNVSHISKSEHYRSLRVIYEFHIDYSSPPGIEPGPLQLQCAPYTKGIMWAVIQSPPLRNESFSY